MKEYIFNLGVIPNPVYTRGIEHKQIIDPRTIWTNPKRKKLTIEVSKKYK